MDLLNDNAHSHSLLVMTNEAKTKIANIFIRNIWKKRRNRWRLSNIVTVVSDQV